MLIKRFNPAETYLDYGDLQRSVSYSANDNVIHVFDQNRTQAAMHAAYVASDEINAAFDHREDVAVLHDLRFVFEGAQLHIDHLFITDNFHVFLVESRTSANKCVVRLEDFVIMDDRQNACAIPSPIKLLKRNRSILKRVFQRMDLPKRFGRPLTPTFHQFILIDNKTELANRAGVDEKYFVTTNQLVKAIENQMPKKSILRFFIRMPGGTLRKIARQVANMHLPKEIRFSKKFKHVMLPGFEHTPWFHSRTQSN